MTYLNVFANLYTKAVATPVVPTVNPFATVSKPASLFSTYKFAYTPSNYPTFPTTYVAPRFNFNFSNLFSSIGNGISTAYNTVKRWGSDLGSSIVSTARKYLNYNEKNGSYKLFTGGKSHAWCADFATYAVKEAFRATGKTLPSGFGSSAVSGLLSWARKNGCFLETAKLSNKASVIKSKVKAGDLVIFKEGGRSHVGIVESIGADGKIHTIEGNTSNKVGKRSYALTDRTITGFAQIA